MTQSVITRRPMGLPRALRSFADLEFSLDFATGGEQDSGVVQGTGACSTRPRGL